MKESTITSDFTYTVWVLPHDVPLDIVCKMALCKSHVKTHNKNIYKHVVL